MSTIKQFWIDNNSNNSGNVFQRGSSDATHHTYNLNADNYTLTTNVTSDSGDGHVNTIKIPSGKTLTIA